jgi:tetratricopeptide (TPR) repeat protein
MSMSGAKGGRVRMGLKFRKPTLVTVVLVGLTSAAGCSKIAELKGNLRFKEANAAYQRQDYQRAIELYEETLLNNPDLAAVYFYLGNSYDNMYQPGFDSPDNQAVIAKAVENYELAAERIPTEPVENLQLKMLSLQYLAAAYGSEKLDDPVKAEPVLQRMITLNPTDTSHYFALSLLYENAGVYDEAERLLLYSKEVKPDDPLVYMTLAGFYNRQGQFDKTIEALEQRAVLEPTNPEAHFTIATYYWDNAQRNVQLNDAEKKENVDKGMLAVNKALEIRPDYIDALVYKGLLLRTDANIERNVGRQQALIKEATALQNKAEELRKLKATGVATSN